MDKEIEIPLEQNKELLLELYKAMADKLNKLQRFHNEVIKIVESPAYPEDKEMELLKLIEEDK